MGRFILQTHIRQKTKPREGQRKRLGFWDSGPCSRFRPTEFGERRGETCAPRAQLGCSLASLGRRTGHLVAGGRKKPSPCVGNGGCQGLSPRHTNLYLHTISQAPRRGSSPRVSQTRGPSRGRCGASGLCGPLHPEPGLSPLGGAPHWVPRSPGLPRPGRSQMCRLRPGHALRRGDADQH